MRACSVPDDADRLQSELIPDRQESPDHDAVGESLTTTMPSSCDKCK